MKNFNNVTSNPAAFQLKGSLITLTVLHLQTHNPTEFAKQLKETVQQTPNFFKNLPIIIDLQALKQSEEMIDFPTITHHLREEGLIPVGIRNANKQQEETAVNAGLGLLSNKKQDKISKTDEPKMLRPKIIHQPIRSGQQIYAQGSDLIILASVSAGAEVLADGHIHIYGALRGRALAGVTGDKTARIFCQQLDAQLVSIAGYYKLQDSLQIPENQGAQIYLEEEHLHITNM